MYQKKKSQPRLRLAFLTDAYLLAEQRFDIQPLRLQDFAQTAQAFNLNLVVAPDVKGELFIDHLITASKVDARQQTADVQVWAGSWAPLATACARKSR